MKENLICPECETSTRIWNWLLGITCTAALTDTLGRSFVIRFSAHISGFQRHSPETNQGCSRETYPVRISRYSCQSHHPGEARGGAPPCTHPHTDFGLLHCGVALVLNLCLYWRQLIQSICGLTGQSKPGVRHWGGAFASGWDPGHTSTLWTEVKLYSTDLKVAFFC